MRRVCVAYWAETETFREAVKTNHEDCQTCVSPDNSINSKVRMGDDPTPWRGDTRVTRHDYEDPGSVCHI